MLAVPAQLTFSPAAAPANTKLALPDWFPTIGILRDVEVVNTGQYPGAAAVNPSNKTIDNGGKPTATAPAAGHVALVDSSHLEFGDALVAGDNVRVTFHPKGAVYAG